MPAVIIEAPQRSERMWQALKTHITKERQRKKQGNFYKYLINCIST